MPDSVREVIASIANATPFLGIVGGKVQVETSRIIENLIAVVLGGAFMGFVTLQVLDTKFEYFKDNITAQVEKLDKKMEDMYRDIYRPLIPSSKNGESGG